MASREDRYFVNNLTLDLNRTELLVNNRSSNNYELSPSFLKSIDDFNIRALKAVLDKYNTYNGTDFSVYTGLTGILCLLLKIRGGGLPDDFVEKAYVQKSLNGMMKRADKEVTYMCGNAGPLTLGALFYHGQNNAIEFQKCVKTLRDLFRHISRPDLPDEVLYGRVGYLYSLLFLRSNGLPVNFDDIIPEVVREIIRSGQRYSRSTRSQCPLMFQWYGEEYLGAAHGVAGILYLLLEAKDFLNNDELALVKASVDYIRSIQFRSGNFPAVMGETSEHLVHWCHGAPGVIFLMLQAYQIFGDEACLQSAKRCGDVIWTKGLLKKGYGLCHGTAGNGYAFLGLYKVTGDPLYLLQAVKFAEWCLGYGSHGCRTPDKPYSLMEGLAGTIYFLNDIKSPLNAKFPAFVV